jgi:CubicO group peptidase (beta-lactamase class C family)
VTVYLIRMGNTPTKVRDFTTRLPLEFPEWSARRGLGWEADGRWGIRSIGTHVSRGVQGWDLPDWSCGVNPSILWHTAPDQVAMDAAILQEGLDSLMRGVAEGRHAGAQLYASRYGRPVVEFACGEAAPGRAMTPDTLTAWFSASKPLTAMGIALAVDRGQLDLDDPVRRYLPEFGAGKEACTIRHVLTHQGGFTNSISHSDTRSWDEIVAAICAYPAEYVPGTRAGYHATSGWYVLAEILRRVDGRRIDRFLREEFFEPLGMRDSFLGIPPARQAELEPRLAKVHLGQTEREHFASPEFISQFNGDAEIARVNPSGGGRGPARDLGRFYELLIAKGRWEERTLIDARTVQLFTACHRWDLPDKTLGGAPLPWGLGFCLYGNADVYTGVSRHVFGHSGMVSGVSFADPDSGLVCVTVTTGLLDPLTNARRLREANGPVVKACRPITDGAPGR